MVKNEFISLAELGLEMGLPKSKLAFYKKSGLIAPAHKISNTDVFNYSDTLKRIKKINELQEKGLKLKEIQDRLK